jgi:hypothetical protein
VLGRRADEQANTASTTCELGHTLEGNGECQNPAEVEFKGIRLCRRHARELYARDRVDLWQAILMQLDIALESMDGQMSEDAKRRLKLRRADAAVELELAQKEMDEQA